jgi:tetratricopeptide (TPR) repeat protein
MILIVFFLTADLSAKIDSLQTLVHGDPCLAPIIELNNTYFLTGEHDLGIALLRKYYDRLDADANASIALHLADDYLYTGDILKARSEYLKLVTRFAGSGYANDALEKVFMIEKAQVDTIKFKTLGYSIFLYQSGQIEACQDSLKPLIKTGLGDYALYYLALAYMKADDPVQAARALEDLNTSFPTHKINNAVLLQAEVYFALDKIKKARTILENLIVRVPNSIYAVRARAMLGTYPAADY